MLSNMQETNRNYRCEEQPIQWLNIIEQYLIYLILLHMCVHVFKIQT